MRTLFIVLVGSVMLVAYEYNRTRILREEIRVRMSKYVGR